MHIPVLLNEITELLPIPPGGILLDGTLGNGGHSKAIIERSKGPITIVGLDKDSKAIERARKNLEGTNAELILEKADYRDFKKVMAANGITEIDGFLLDLGFSSDQLENSGRGFSFQRPEPLLMTLDDDPKEGHITASEIVNHWAKENLEIIFRNYGEERSARRIAEAIVDYRGMKSIETSLELGDLIAEAVGRRGKVHPATKTFQALRIAVNDEIGSLRETLPRAAEVLKPGGRLAVISFHSLEDRVVKQFGKQIPELGALTKKPIVAGRGETSVNPRARSAKLRVFSKVMTI
ncbi:MAG: 16S rRNA (cytosine(1402)-N(4))-methyltransferase RsmH [Candidatus Taylorbacteria bacterium]|nr:16S rRNA (cytosine(1402)-N(4))-methyltransferase RsmH [Candidatus Taylorbacteria bacterium]